jgi:hypothetical protein
MSEDQSKLRDAVERYKLAAESLEDELIQVFNAHRRKTREKLWEPLNSIQSEEDIPTLDEVVKEVGENIDRLAGFQQKKENRSTWDKIKSGLGKFAKCTVPVLTNFMIATKDAQQVITREH